MSRASTWPGWRSRCGGGTPTGSRRCPDRSAPWSPPERTTGLDQYLPLISGRAVDLAAGHNLPVSPVGFFGHLAPAAAAVPNHALTEVQGFALPAGIRADWDSDDDRIVLGITPGNGLSLDESAVRPPVEAGALPPEGPHVRPADAGLRMTLHG